MPTADFPHSCRTWAPEVVLPGTDGSEIACDRRPTVEAQRQPRKRAKWKRVGKILKRMLSVCPNREKKGQPPLLCGPLPDTVFLHCCRTRAPEVGLPDTDMGMRLRQAAQRGGSVPTGPEG